MFDLKNTRSEQSGSFTCCSFCKNSGDAEQIRTCFIGCVRQISIFADLYHDGPKLIVEAADESTLIKIADILNHAVDWENYLL